MLTTEKISVISKILPSCLCVKKKNINGRFGGITVSMAKKVDSSQKSNPNSPLRFSKKVATQTAVAVLGLGFIDAGYSGDWSRIGVISKGTEDLLKAAAFFVVPLCFLLVFSISNTSED